MLPRRTSTMEAAMLELTEHDDVLEIRLARPPANALNPDLIVALRKAVEDANHNDAGAIMLSGREGMFCAGLDVIALSKLDRATMLQFYHDFVALWHSLSTSRAPVAAAITGHAPAGGAALTLFCDYSVMADGDYKIGLNEVAVGLAVPSPICVALARRVGPHLSERMLVEGRLVDPKTAERIGMIDACVDQDAVLDDTLQWCRRVAGLAHFARDETRRIARQSMLTAFDNPSTTPEGFVDMWFGDEAQATVRTLIEKLQGKSAA